VFESEKEISYENNIRVSSDDAVHLLKIISFCGNEIIIEQTNNLNL
jgi:hypothetical protein